MFYASLESNGQAAMTPVGPSLRRELVLYLLCQHSTKRRAANHCAPEVLKPEGRKAYRSIFRRKVRSGVTSLVLDLAQTLHEPTELNPDVVTGI